MYFMKFDFILGNSLLNIPALEVYPYIRHS